MRERRPWNPIKSMAIMLFVFAGLWFTIAAVNLYLLLTYPYT